MDCSFYLKFKQRLYDEIQQHKVLGEKMIVEEKDEAMRRALEKAVAFCDRLLNVFNKGE